MSSKIKITSKKRSAHAAGLSQDPGKVLHDDPLPLTTDQKKEIKDKQEKDIAELAEHGVVSRYETEVPQENDEEEMKRLKRKDYQKRKVKKQKMNKKGMEISTDDNDLVKLYSNADEDGNVLPITNLTYHLGVANKNENLRMLKKKKRLAKNLMEVDDDKEVLLQQDEIEHVINNPKNKLLPINEIKTKNKKEKQQQQQQQQNNNKDNQNNNKNNKNNNKQQKKSMLSNEVNAQLALLNSVAEQQEQKVHTKILKEKSKIEFFEDKEKKRLEKKEKEKLIRNTVLAQVREKQKQEKLLKKELAEFKNEQ